MRRSQSQKSRRNARRRRDVRILRHEWGREIELARIGPGSVFGEMSILDKPPVSAAVVAEGPVDVIRIDRVELEIVLLCNRSPQPEIFASYLETIF